MATMTDTRIMVCEACGGDGGFEVPYVVNYNDGSVLSHWDKCEACSGRGEIEVEVKPVGPGNSLTEV